MIRRSNPRSAFTLIEVLITMIIVAIVGLSAIASLVFGIYIRQLRAERNGAMRVAGELLEETRKIDFRQLREKSIPDVPIDSRGTATTADDTRATVVLRFYDQFGNRVGTTLEPLPLDRSMVRAEAIVTWRSPGHMSDRQQILSLNTLIAP